MRHLQLSKNDTGSLVREQTPNTRFSEEMSKSLMHIFADKKKNLETKKSVAMDERRWAMDRKR